MKLKNYTSFSVYCNSCLLDYIIHVNITKLYDVNLYNDIVVAS